jgi:hypothetical protein
MYKKKGQKMDALATEPSRPRAWHQIWLDIWLHPGLDSFKAALAEPDTGTGRAYRWVAVMGLISGLVSVLIELVLPTPTSSQLPANSRGIFLGAVAVGAVLCTPFAAVIGLAISAWIYHGISRLLGGQGTGNRLIYAFGAIYAPLMLISTVFLVPSALVRQLGDGAAIGSLCLSIIPLAVSIYSIVLYVNAIKAVEGFSTGRAIAVIALLALIGLVLSGCLIGGIFALGAMRVPR